MKISIITTIYRAEKDLPQLLDSMMAQESSEIEFFLIDNGSPDRCGEICREYAKKDTRFTVFTIKENIGYIRARNIGIQECNGDYIGFCDSDDFLEPGAYDVAVKKIKEEDCDLYITSYRTIFEKKIIETRIPYELGVYTGKRIKKDILPQAFGNINGKPQFHGFVWKQIYRRDIIVNNKILFIEELKPYEDQIFNIDMIQNCERIYVDNNLLYNYIVNEQSITAKMVTNFDASAEWNRISLLYKEKKKRAQNSLLYQAGCNQALLSVYSLILNMVKKKEGSVKRNIDEFLQITDYEILEEMLENMSLDDKGFFGFIVNCLRKHRYRRMFTVAQLGVKLKKG